MIHLIRSLLQLRQVISSSHLQTKNLLVVKEPKDQIKQLFSYLHQNSLKVIQCLLMLLAVCQEHQTLIHRTCIRLFMVCTYQVMPPNTLQVHLVFILLFIRNLHKLILTNPHSPNQATLSLQRLHPNSKHLSSSLCQSGSSRARVI